MKTESNLEKVLAAGHLAVTSECGPPRGAVAKELTDKAKYLEGVVDAVDTGRTDVELAFLSRDACLGCADDLAPVDAASA